MIILIVSWLVVGFVGACMNYHFMQETWPHLADKQRVSDSIIALLLALSGPWCLSISILTPLIIPNKYGFRLPFVRRPVR